MYKNGFGINNLQWLMSQKTKPNQTKPNKPKCLRYVEHKYNIVYH